ncbi:unnamed protein product [Rotaria sordida]|uniref:Methionyl/Leucyl tRNA synthetase domain-containing protein n=1 Tax=Rotaria sordida TaxID=392033 RepID=A0A820G4L8_9BILA|nr:unnamed protein product [Rotaria sordida]CAF4271941.1 unnamed protein product [Rotaria sordida]
MMVAVLRYINNVPHLDILTEALLNADVFLCVEKIATLYIYGTDEYSTATETKALLGPKYIPRETCDRYFDLH